MNWLSRVIGICNLARVLAITRLLSLKDTEIINIHKLMLAGRTPSLTTVQWTAHT